MSKIELDELVEDELGACDRMLEQLEVIHNSPKRVARRDRISKHIGRPLFRDDLPSILNTTVSDDELVRRIELFKSMGCAESSRELEIELLKRGAS